MATYRIVGAHKVAGHHPGDAITAEQLLEVGAHADHLVAAGHLAVSDDVTEPVTKARRANPAPSQADEADIEES